MLIVGAEFKSGRLTWVMSNEKRQCSDFVLQIVSADARTFHVPPNESGHISRKFWVKCAEKASWDTVYHHQQYIESYISSNEDSSVSYLQIGARYNPESFAMRFGEIRKRCPSQVASNLVHINYCNRTSRTVVISHQREALY